MTDSSKPAGEAMAVPIILDAVAGHLHRRATNSEAEALALANALRNLAAENDALRARLAELESKEVE